MFKRRKRKNKPVNDTQAGSSQSVRAPNPDNPQRTAPAAFQETKAPSLLSDAFKNIVEKAADRSRIELVSEGKIKPMAFFIDGNGSMKTVSLLIRDDYQKEALLRRIREKVSAENVSTVVILTEMDNKRGAVLTGVTSEMRGSASIDYSFDEKTKTVTSWKMAWLNQPLRDAFFDGIFGKSS